VVEDVNANAQFNAKAQTSSKKQYTTKENFRAYFKTAMESGQIVHEYEV
jgi:hypothetical protein